MKKALTFFAAPYRLEILFWSIALVIPAFIDPSTPHFSYCIFKHLGFEFCPGCGLGRSLAYLYRGDITQSFLCHPLGLIALPILLYRIMILTLKLIELHKTRLGGIHG
ncbi:conserved hypothetical protein [Candidatus Zixiibacteriota bacterium]|nr:conserved hypothetical protein [candidate division Zixibacteria bacterium]